MLTGIGLLLSPKSSEDSSAQISLSKNYDLTAIGTLTIYISLEYYWIPASCSTMVTNPGYQLLHNGNLVNDGGPNN